MWLERLIVLAVALAWLAVPAGAQNILVNTTFDTGTTPWSHLGRITHVGDDGNPDASGPGCMELGRTPPDGSGSSYALQDVPARPNTPYVLSGWARIPLTSPAESAAMYVQFFNSGGSHVGQTFVQRLEVAGGPWTELKDEFVSPAAAAEARVRFGLEYDVSGSSEAFVRWDDLHFGPAPVFSDGFEGGTLDAWSSVSL